MTDAALPARSSRLDLRSDDARARIAARYRSERRFRALGLGAIVLTGVFLLVLLADVVGRGLPAFVQHSLVLNVAVPADFADGKRDEAALRAADYDGLIRKATQEAFPGLTGRQNLRTLANLVSTGGSDELRRRVLADPGLIGQTLRVPALLSDDADLYFKGHGTRIESAQGAGSLTYTVDGSSAVLRLPAPAQAALLAAAKDDLRAAAARLRREASRQTGAAGGAVSERVTRAGELEKLAAVADAPSALASFLPTRLVALQGGLVQLTEIGPTEAKGEVLLPFQRDAAAGSTDSWSNVVYRTPADDRKIRDLEVALLDRLRAEGKVDRHFNVLFFTSGDSREPELAGIRGALIGSFLTLTVTLLICLPLGVMAAIYLEEFAPRNAFTELVEVNINNLAAVPSIVFGLLGLAVFLNFFDLPRSASLVGGLVLALLVLPTIIIASRAALKAVPPSIKEAALGVGASHQQAVFHHVLPLAMPGIMTGTIIGMAHALGETAPLLMIGMMAFIVDVPKSFVEAATVMPVQIFLWSDLPEQAFQAKTAAAILVLLGFLFLMNGAAIWLRKKFERRW